MKAYNLIVLATLAVFALLIVLFVVSFGLPYQTMSTLLMLPWIWSMAQQEKQADQDRMTQLDSAELEADRKTRLLVYQMLGNDDAEVVRLWSGVCDRFPDQDERFYWARLLCELEFFRLVDIAREEYPCREEHWYWDKVSEEQGFDPRR